MSYHTLFIVTLHCILSFLPFRRKITKKVQFYTKIRQKNSDELSSVPIILSCLRSKFRNLINVRNIKSCQVNYNEPVMT